MAEESLSPAVTVVVPTYQRAAVLSRALDSVLRQTFEDFELLVVDDASTDSTPSVLAQYDDPRVRYLRQEENGGVAAARNRGICEARGNYIAFLDSDDEWLPEKLEAQVDLLKKAPAEVGVVYSGVQDVDGSGRMRVRHVPVHRGDLYRTLLLENVIHGCSGVMIRAAVVERVGLFDEQIPAIEDYDYWLRISSHYQFEYVEAPLLLYHDDRDEERMSTDGEKNLKAREYFHDKHGAAMREAGVEPLFVLESSRRALHWYRDRRRARRLALQAIRLAPRHPDAYRAFVRALPRPLHEALAAAFRLVRWTTRPLERLVRR